MKVLVTGGTGFAGKHLIKYLDKKKYHLHCIVRDDKKLMKSFDNALIDRITFSLIKRPEECTPALFKSIIEENKIDTVVHNAAIAREYSASASMEYNKVNVEWTRKLAQGYIGSDIKHNKFVYISTVGVYGTNPLLCPAHEDTPYNPDGKYHNSKMMAEKELLDLRNYNKFPLIILRPSIMYGDADYGFVYKIFKLTSKGFFPLSTRNYKIHVLDLDNLAQTVETVISIPKESNCIYNVADKSPVEMRDILEFIKDNIGGGYFELPSATFSFLKFLSGANSPLNIKFKLISDSWYYNTNRLENDYEIKLSDTFSGMTKYIDWYRGAN